MMIHPWIQAQATTPSKLPPSCCPLLVGSQMLHATAGRSACGDRASQCRNVSDGSQSTGLPFDFPRPACLAVAAALDPPPHHTVLHQDRLRPPPDRSRRRPTGSKRGVAQSDPCCTASRWLTDGLDFRRLLQRVQQNSHPRFRLSKFGQSQFSLTVVAASQNASHRDERRRRRLPGIFLVRLHVLHFGWFKIIIIIIIICSWIRFRSASAAV
ncbi:hypothetical protein B0T16DRAFT_233393 [Cercophora newfieldiana]|uniref:Uncharacterized protein n=1 Tax=Cercophora newfieldiana TaxID=92897 RepID=A0AA39XSB7_9PEZI|nr:hypothetical protein B0T16DRAFT_233393 [Cercophora newfieldiana]